MKPILLALIVTASPLVGLIAIAVLNLFYYLYQNSLPFVDAFIFTWVLSSYIAAVYVFILIFFIIGFFIIKKYFECNFIPWVVMSTIPFGLVFLAIFSTVDEVEKFEAVSLNSYFLFISTLIGVLITSFLLRFTKSVNNWL